MSGLTGEMVKAMYQDAYRKFDASGTDKDDSDLMDLVGSFLDMIGVQDKDMFTDQFTTTIGERIYYPYEVGIEGSHGYTLWNQVTTLVHELVHVQQYHKAPINFALRYIGSLTDRAHFESEAYAADLEMHVWRHGAPYNIPGRASVLKFYGCGQEEVDFMTHHLETVALMLFDPDGDRPSFSGPAAWAMYWLEMHIPSLKHGGA